MDALGLFLIFLSGGIAGWFSHEHRGALSRAWGKAWGLVMGSAPARDANTRVEMEALAPSVRPNYPDLGLTTPETAGGGAGVRPKQGSLGLTRAAGNVLQWLSGALGFLLRYWKPIALVLLALFIFALMRGCSLPFEFKSKGELRLERELAEREAQFQETLRERDEAITAIRVQTARTLEQIRVESRRGHDAIAAATPEHEEEIDPALVAAFRDALDGLCVPRADGTRSDTCRS